MYKLKLLPVKTGNNVWYGRYFRVGENVIQSIYRAEYRLWLIRAETETRLQPFTADQIRANIDQYIRRFSERVLVRVYVQV